MRDLTVSIVQDELNWQDAAANRARMQQHIDALPDTDLIVLPEMFASGFTMTPAECAETMDGPTVAWMREQARARDAAIGGSLVIEDDGRYYNRFVFMPPDGECSHYDKRHRFALAGEDREYARGERRVVVEFRGWRIVPLVCYDLRFPVWCRYPASCDLMLFVANWPSPRRSAWSALLKARAIENQCFVAGVNRVGRDGNDVHYSGDSAVLDLFGEALVDCGERAGAHTVTLDARALATARDKLPFFRDADDFELR